MLWTPGRFGRFVNIKCHLLSRLYTCRSVYFFVSFTWLCIKIVTNFNLPVIWIDQYFGLLVIFKSHENISMELYYLKFNNSQLNKVGFVYIGYLVNFTVAS